MLLVIGVIEIAVDCGVAVNARGVIVGVIFSFEGVRPLQAVRNIKSKLIPAHFTYLAVYLLVYCFASLRDREEKLYVRAMLTHAEMNAHINLTVIV